MNVARAGRAPVLKSRPGLHPGCSVHRAPEKPYRQSREHGDPEASAHLTGV